MNKDEFIASNNVRTFIKWVEQYIDGEKTLGHSYYYKKESKDYYFPTIYTAFELYSWNRMGYEETELNINRIREVLEIGLREKDSIKCKQACLDILKWGGVLQKNDKKIEKMVNDEKLVEYLNIIKDKLSSTLDLQDYYFDGFLMNAGFTKIYSILMDSFIIYDSRVGSSICFLVRKYCEETGVDKIPDELKFTWAAGRTTSEKSTRLNGRNPSSEKYKFSLFTQNPKKHLESNIKANWLLSEILDSTDTNFSLLEQKGQMRALESALFMLGYQVNFMKKEN